ncbi:MAG: hypothetical protein JW395_2170 [Nitrospira sp.]|nr:hypothetical protein [Nitrospira sp.]
MLDKTLVAAITEVVVEAGQPKAVAQRLVAWLTRWGEAEPSVDENTQFLSNVQEALVVGEKDAD